MRNGSAAPRCTSKGSWSAGAGRNRAGRETDVRDEMAVEDVDVDKIQTGGSSGRSRLPNDCGHRCRGPP